MTTSPLSDLKAAVGNSVSASAKGKALESLLCALFEVVPGITITRRNTKDIYGAEEIDIAFWNEQDGSGFPFLPWIILLECKNWSTAVGAEQVSWFDAKLRSRGVDFGILVAAKGITGQAENVTAAHKIVSDALADGRRIVVLTLSDLLPVESADALVLLIKRMLCDLHLKGTTIAGAV